jgi:hypothetical protein
LATLGELTGRARRLALVGLAKNTGKTVTLAALLSELERAGRRVGVTSVGRDGEQHDVIDFRIDKPPVRLAAGSLVATTDGLLRASGIPHELLERTGIRTPLGEVLIAGLRGGGAIEVAGPSAAADARRVADAMLAHGAEQVLIDGAIDRRAASSPDVADGLVMATGAILSEDLEAVIARTADAVALVRLATVPRDTPAGRRLRELAGPGGAGAGATSLLVASGGGEPLELPARFALSAQGGEIAALLAERPEADALILAGALPEAFVRDLAVVARRAGRELTVVVSDPTRAFLAERGPEHYARQGVRIQTLAPIDLIAMTVNPVAPQSHGFDSARLRGRLGEAIPELPIFDVMHPSYAVPQTVREPARSAPRGG